MDTNNPTERTAIQQWITDNLLSTEDAAKITGQTINAFRQSVKLRLVEPFFESEGKGPAKVRLYLKADMENYAKNKRK
ncbi:hypothetical protein IW510_18615 [Enterococcus sp. BWR-S5]|nr:hypothetical protein [Enterococcus sp. BWR-S5]